MTRIAVLQAQAEPLSIDLNLAAVQRAAAEAKEAGAELLVTPELFVTGYAPARIRAELGQEPVHAAEDALRRIAREQSISIVASLPGRETPEERGITALLIADDGAVLARYQKVQLFGPEEKASFVAGEEPPAVVDHLGRRLGLLVCYDVEFPEMVRAAAAQSADLLLVPTALAQEPAVQDILLPARALESRVALAYANHCGTEDGLTFDGGSVVLDISGHPLAAAAAEPDLLIVDVPAPSEAGPEGPWYRQDRRAHLHRRWL
ncbi:nitrilase-related carbon-nitrogen hydrolase [Nesterenkonia sp. NBAIMH1]|uniref:nitrilase-related carbon-nitrogen hydrolase n=1 Tax=Nesterenkonia sp. NBAIMH1 TaxID=2600320 RepID=UPI0011B51D05|nr:nitrilase-related carbon-nitrogen hydrolase [Nesterenkonia sp. NBAIMH1]